MTAISFYFQVHQPYRLLPLRPTDVGKGQPWFDEGLDRLVVQRVAERCYLPMNKILLEQIEKTDKRFRCAFSITGTVLQQLRDHAPEALDSFVALAESGCVEFLAETSHHSLSYEADPDEFTEQVSNHAAEIARLFGQKPTTFRNTELCIDEALAHRVEAMGFDALLGEGSDGLLGWRSPQYVYRPRGCETLKLLLRSYVFSDDIAFRFSNKEWPAFPLFADTFASWLHAVPERAQFIGLFMDYETFGEHQWEETGILEFMRYLPGFVLEDERFSFQTPAEVAAACEPAAEIAIPGVVSWADEERDLSAWLGNPMQQEANEALYALSARVHRAAAEGRPELLEEWRRLTTSDHVYYMCTKYHSDGDVHEYFSPYESPHEAFVRFMNVLKDLDYRIEHPHARPAESSAASAEPAAPAGTRKIAQAPRAPEPAAPVAPSQAAPKQAPTAAAPPLAAPPQAPAVAKPAPRQPPAAPPRPPGPVEAGSAKAGPGKAASEEAASEETEPQKPKRKFPRSLFLRRKVRKKRGS